MCMHNHTLVVLNSLLVGQELLHQCTHSSTTLTQNGANGYRKVFLTLYFLWTGCTFNGAPLSLDQAVLCEGTPVFC